MFAHSLPKQGEHSESILPPQTLNIMQVMQKKANEWNDQRTQDFESEFVEILNQQCFRFLYQKLEKARESPEGPLSTRNISLASSKEVLKYISELGISKVALRVEDIEAILVCISQRL